MAVHCSTFSKHKALLRFVDYCSRTSRFSHQLSVVSTEKPKYPPILDVSPEGLSRHNRQLWYDSIKDMPTVEEKLYEFAVKQEQTSPIYLMNAACPTYNGPKFQVYITKTHMVQDLPPQLMSVNVDDDLSVLRDAFCEVLAKQYYNPWKQEMREKNSDLLTEPEWGSKLVQGLLSQCYKKLALKKDYLLDSTLHRKPLVKSFWWHGDFKSKDNLINEQNLCFQFADNPSYAIRTKKLLPPIVPLDDALCSSGEVLDYNYHPKHFGDPEKLHYCISTIAGFWPGDPIEYPLLQVYTTDKIKPVSQLNDDELKTLENGFGAMSSFGWLNAIATYQGFTPFQDLTYPIVGHTILTNGQDWSFFTYQLNTIGFHNDVDKKDRRNICWASGKMRLFDAIEDGQIKGVNDEVFLTLLKLFLYVPELNSNIQLKPYLGEDSRSEEEILDTRNKLRRMYVNSRPFGDFHKAVPMWQKIYKFHKDAPPSPQIRME